MDLYDNAPAGDASRFRPTDCSVVPLLAQAEAFCEALIASKGRSDP
jgi:hypothetical protein